MTATSKCECCEMVRLVTSLDDDGMCTKCRLRGCTPERAADECEELAYEEWENGGEGLG